jgi:hypothetical protein
VHPRYRSVVWTETWPRRKLDLFELAAGQMTDPGYDLHAENVALQRRLVLITRKGESPYIPVTGGSGSSTSRRARGAIYEYLSPSIQRRMGDRA